MLNYCWRGLACASLLFLVLPASAVAQTETRFFRIGAASTGGSFFEIGGIVASAISSPVEGSACGTGGECGVPGLVAVAQATQGSMENLRLINSGQLESGFAQADLATMAYSGTGAFADDGPMPRLRVRHCCRWRRCRIASTPRARASIPRRRDGVLKFRL